MTRSPLFPKESVKLGDSSSFKYRLRDPILTMDNPTDPELELLYNKLHIANPIGELSTKSAKSAVTIVSRLESLQRYEFVAALKRLLATQFPLTWSIQLPAFLTVMWAESTLDPGSHSFAVNKQGVKHLATSGLLQFRRGTLHDTITDGIVTRANNSHYRSNIDLYAKILGLPNARIALDKAAAAWPEDTLKKSKIINNTDLFVPTLHHVYLEAKALTNKFRFTPEDGWIPRSSHPDVLATFRNFQRSNPVIPALLKDYQLGVVALLTVLNVSGLNVFRPGHRHTIATFKDQHTKRYNTIKDEYATVNSALEKVSIPTL